MVVDTEYPEALSPELVLVDLESALSAREALDAPEDTLDRILRQSPEPVISYDEAVAAARRRIVELADVEPPTPRRRHQLPKLVGAFATWSVVAIMVVDTGLYRLVPH